MRVNGFQCDSCFTIGNRDKLEGWIISYHYKTNKEMDYTEQHFCSLHCLYEWVKKQMDLQKIDLKKDMDAVFDKLEKDKLEKQIPVVEPVVISKDDYMRQFAKEHNHEFGEIS